GVRRLDRAGELLGCGFEMQISRNVLLARLKMDDPISGHRVIDCWRVQLTKENKRNRHRAAEHCHDVLFAHDEYLYFCPDRRLRLKKSDPVEPTSCGCFCIRSLPAHSPLNTPPRSRSQPTGRAIAHPS